MPDPNWLRRKLRKLVHQTAWLIREISRVTCQENQFCLATNSDIIKKMFVYLSDEVRRYFQLLVGCSFPENPTGFLVGHKKGTSFILESAFPGKKAFFNSPDEFWQTAQIFNQRLVGFYSLQPPAAYQEKLLQPLTTGFLFLHLELSDSGKLIYHPYLIDFDQGFYLKPLNLIPAEGKK